MEEIAIRSKRNERILVTTLTKINAEDMTEYLLQHDIRANYIHSDVATLDRVEIMNALRAGEYDVLVGVNLLREGLDLPEVSLVAILDADKEGFLRNHRSLTQTAGRAARNVNGKVIMYADTITESMQRTIDETVRRRSIQLKYNEEHGITPRQIIKSINKSLVSSTSKTENIGTDKAPAYKPYIEPESYNMVADPIEKAMSTEEIQKRIADAELMMKKAAKELDFITAAQIRDEIIRMKDLLKQKK